MIKLNLKYRHALLLCMALLTIGTISCEKEEEKPTPAVTDQPIILDCNDFKQSKTLVDNPLAPVDYVITCKMRVVGDLVIEPGVVIEFEQNAGIALYDANSTVSSISAVGTATKPIIMTGKVKQKGYWSGLFIDSNNTKNKLSNVIVEYAGGEPFNSNDDRGNIIVYAAGKLDMQSCTIRQSATYGLNATYTESDLTVENSTFTGNATPVIVKYIYVGAMSKTNDYTGNTLDRVILEKYTSTLSTATLWQKINVPYRTEGGDFLIHAPLTIEPGTIIEMGSGTSLRIRDDGNYAGSLKMVGTPTDPIIMRGETNSPGAWKNIYFNSDAAVNEIAYAEISNSGQNPTASQGGVHVWFNSRLNIHDVTFRNLYRNAASTFCAIEYELTFGQVMNPTLSISNITLDNVDCEQSEAD